GGDRTFSHGRSRLFTQLSTQAPLAQGPVGRTAKCAAADCYLYLEEPYAQSARATFLRTCACAHQAAGKILADSRLLMSGCGPERRKSIPARMSAIEGTSGLFASRPDPTLVTQLGHEAENLAWANLLDSHIRLWGDLVRFGHCPGVVLQGVG